MMLKMFYPESTEEQAEPPPATPFQINNQQYINSNA
jgi:hypothetical protein